MKNSYQAEQIKQDEEYHFPYHYIPQIKDGFTQNYNWIWGINYIAAINFIIEEVDKENNINTIADIGCGDGRLTKELTERFTTKEILGIDFSQRAINLAKALNPTVQYYRKDIVNDEIKEKFDAITLVEVFEHIPPALTHDFALALSNLLNKNGLIYLTVPHINKPVIKKHFQHFSYQTLTKYFKNSFDVIDFIYIDKQTILFNYIKKLMTNKLFVINSKWINNIIYRYYLKNIFFANEYNCGRIYLKLKKK